MTPTKEVLDIAPNILRIYGTSFILLPFNIYSTCYFQSLMKPQIAFIISVGRGLVFSSAFILLLPILISPNTIWGAMTCAEIITFIFVFVSIKKDQKTQLTLLSN